MEDTKTAFQAFVSSIITMLVAVLTYSAATELEPKAEVKTEIKACEPDSTYALFQEKLAASAKPATPSATATPKVEPAASSTVTRLSPNKVAGSRWNVEGDWNYSAAEIASHLSRVHGVDPSGYSKQEMEAMHDNLHNGYPAMGYSTTSTTAAKPVVTYSQPTKYYTVPTYSSRTGLFGTRRTTRTYSSSCPGGVCPQ